MACSSDWEHGAASTIRTKDNFGKTPMNAACVGGYLNVTKWLFEMGAAEDIRTKDDRSVQTPMCAVCYCGHLDVAKLLFEGAADDIRTKNEDGCTPMLFACCCGLLQRRL